MPAGVAAADLLAAWLGPGTVLLVGCRCAPLLLAVPRLGVVGRMVALVFGTLLLVPLLAPVVPAALTGPGARGLGATLWPLCLRELLIGGTLALAATLPWAVAQAVGTLLDEGRATLQAPRSREATQLYGALALALFFGLGGARMTLSALAASYELLPLPTAQHPLTAALPAKLLAAAHGLIVLSGQLLALAIRLALPLLGAQLLAELLLALPARWLGGRAARPSPVRSLLGLGVLLLGAHALFPEFGKLLLLGPALLRQALDTR